MSEETPIEEPSPRIAVANELRDILPEWNIIASPREADSVSKPTVLLWTGSAERVKTFKLEHMKWSIETWLTVPRVTDPGVFEENLDKALLEYIGAIEGIDSIEWSAAERGALKGQIEGYRVEVSCVYRFTE